MAEPMTLEDALVVSDQASPLPAKAHLALQVLRAEVERLQANKPSRESCMVVLRRKADGTPEVWCDPEIADLVSALNAGGIPTVASCSGHDHRPGSIALADGRYLVVAKDEAEWQSIEDHFPFDINGQARVHPAKPTQILRVTRERRGEHTYRLADGRLIYVPEDVHYVELREAAGPTDVYYPAPSAAGDITSKPDLCKRLLAGDDVKINLTANRPEGEGSTFDALTLPRPGEPMPRWLRVWDVGYHARTLTLVVQKTVHGDDAFSPQVDTALEEFVAECRKDPWDRDPAKLPIAGIGAAKGCFTASNGVRIDWIASELDPPEAPHG